MSYDHCIDAAGNYSDKDGMIRQAGYVTLIVKYEPISRKITLDLIIRDAFVTNDSVHNSWSTCMKRW